jgi:AcrR family transcriptional regulator
MAVAVTAPFLNNPAVARRWELYRAAAPLLERHGYRSVTVESIARACLISPAGLYYYFPSKIDLVLFPLSHANGLCAEWQRQLSALPSDPLIRLNALLDFVGEHVPDIRLALRLGREIGNDRRLAGQLQSVIREAEADFTSVARTVAASVSPARARDFFEGIVAVVAGDVPGVVPEATDIRRRLGDVARGWATSLGVTAAEFDGATARSASAPSR